MRSSVIAAVLLLALCCVAGVDARTNRPTAPAAPYHAPVLTGSDRLRNQRGTLPPVAQDASYSPIMAYQGLPARAPTPIYQAIWEVEDYHANGGYDLEMEAVVDNAKLFAQRGKAANNSVWIFDVDETALSGYDHIKSMGFGWVTEINHAWVEAAIAPAIPQVMELYQVLLKNGFRVIFLTGRKDSEHAATVRNLEKQGYLGFDTLITRGPTEVDMTAAEYKSLKRTQLVEKQGFDIVGCIGDQWSDLHGPYTGFKVKLPNYMYYLV